MREQEGLLWQDHSICIRHIIFWRKQRTCSDGLPTSATETLFFP